MWQCEFLQIVHPLTVKLCVCVFKNLLDSVVTCAGNLYSLLEYVCF